jgi:hypothetical protein
VAAFGRYQGAALEAPASPRIAGQLQTRQYAAEFVDGKRDAVCAAFPVMPSAFCDLKIFRSIGNRPAQTAAGRSEAVSKLGAVIRVMAARFTVGFLNTVLHTMYRS